MKYLSIEVSKNGKKNWCKMILNKALIKVPKNGSKTIHTCYKRPLIKSNKMDKKMGKQVSPEVFKTYFSYFLTCEEIKV